MTASFCVRRKKYGLHVNFFLTFGTGWGIMCKVDYFTEDMV